MPPTSSSSSSPPTASSSPEGAEVLDLCGEVCPFTFVRARLRLEELPLGARLRILVDHEPASRNIPRSAREWGQEVAAVELAGDRLWAVELIKRVD
jgi:tRNA 2-thiouridine synthesizing protein A